MNPWLIEQMIRDRMYRPQWDSHWEPHYILEREPLWDARQETQALRAATAKSRRGTGKVRRLLHQFGILLAGCGQWLQQKNPSPPCYPPATPRSVS